jgi:hypothetical protein
MATTVKGEDKAGAEAVDLVARDVQEYATHLRNGGARLGLLAARSTYTGKGTDNINIPAVKLGKVSLNDFARRANTSDNRVGRYRRAWDAFAAANIADTANGLPNLVQSGDLKPGQEIEGLDWAAKWPLPVELQWETFYSAEAPSRGHRTAVTAAESATPIRPTTVVAEQVMTAVRVASTALEAWNGIDPTTLKDWERGQIADMVSDVIAKWREVADVVAEATSEGVVNIDLRDDVARATGATRLAAHDAQNA